MERRRADASSRPRRRAQDQNHDLEPAAPVQRGGVACEFSAAAECTGSNSRFGARAASA